MHLRRRKEIYEDKYPETKAEVKRLKGLNVSEEIISSLENAPPTFAEDTASKLNITERTVRQEIQIAEMLTPDVRQKVKELGIPKSEALKLARLEPEKQMETLAKLKAKCSDAGTIKCFVCKDTRFRIIGKIC